MRKAVSLLSGGGRETAQSHKSEVGRESKDAFRRASSILWREQQVPRGLEQDWAVQVRGAR